MPRTTDRPEFYPGLPVTEGMLIPTDPALPPVPLKHTDIQAAIIGPVCDVLVTQQFHNTHSRPVEAVYVFPLPEDAAVTALTLTIGERTIEGTIREREQAQRDYAQARDAGQGAALLEQERPNIFTISVANIQPDEQITVALRFHDRVPYDDGTFEFVLPTVVLPRYIPPEPSDSSEPAASVADAERLYTPLLSEGMRSGHTLAIRVALDAGRLHGLASPTHEIETQEQHGQTIVTLRAGEHIPNKDFMLRYRVAGSHIEAVPFTYRAAAEPGTVLLMITPRLELQPEDVLPRELLFVFDRSGSMGGDSIIQARNALQSCLRSLNPDDTFNILPFDDDVETFAPRSVSFTQEQVDQADAYIQQIQARGGTQILKALSAAFEQPRDSERLRVIVFLTDGAVGNEDEVLREVRKGLNEARVYAFGIGSAVNRFLLDKLAEVGRGSVEYIFPGQSLEDAVQRFQNRAAFPVLADVQVDWGDGRVTDVYPEPLPDLYAGQPLAILGRFHKAGHAQVRLTGRTPGGTYEQTLHIDWPEATPDRGEHWAALPRLWARARIDALMSRERDDPKQKSKVRDEILGMALEYRLLSPYTAFVAIEQRRSEHAGRESAERVVVPIHLPQGTQREAFEPTWAAYAAPGGTRRTKGMAAPMIAAAPAAPTPDAEDPLVAFLAAPAEQAGLPGQVKRVAERIMGRFGGGQRKQARQAGRAERAITLPEANAAEDKQADTQRALHYLARTQSVSGAWADAEIATALVLLAFLKEGHSDRAGTFRPQLTRAVRWLIARASQPAVSPVVAWALAALAAQTGATSHQQARDAALTHAAAADALEQAALDYARQMMQGQAIVGSGLPGGAAIGTLPQDERGMLALVVQLQGQPEQAHAAAAALAQQQQRRDNTDGAVVPAGGKADRPDAALFAATAALVLLQHEGNSL